MNKMNPYPGCFGIIERGRSHRRPVGRKYVRFVEEGVVRTGCSVTLPGRGHDKAHLVEAFLFRGFLHIVVGIDVIIVVFFFLIIHQVRRRLRCRVGASCYSYQDTATFDQPGHSLSHLGDDYSARAYLPLRHPMKRLRPVVALYQSDAQYCLRIALLPGRGSWPAHLTDCPQQDIMKARPPPRFPAVLRGRRSGTAAGIRSQETDEKLFALRQTLSESECHARL